MFCNILRRLKETFKRICSAFIMNRILENFVMYFMRFHVCTRGVYNVEHSEYITGVTKTCRCQE
jgi:hypothetical protein